MKYRFVIYYVIYLWACFIGSPFRLCLKLFVRFDQFNRYHGIIIGDVATSANHSKEFFEITIAALDLIKTTDSRRFELLQKQIRMVVGTRNHSAASYHQCGGICLVDIKQLLSEKNSEWWIKNYACTLVHEATHGRFFQARIPYIKQTRSRIERACITESLRFAKRWTNDSFDWDSYLRLELNLK